MTIGTNCSTTRRWLGLSATSTGSPASSSERASSRRSSSSKLASGTSMTATGSMFDRATGVQSSDDGVTAIMPPPASFESSVSRITNDQTKCAPYLAVPATSEQDARRHVRPELTSHWHGGRRGGYWPKGRFASAASLSDGSHDHVTRRIPITPSSRLSDARGPVHRVGSRTRLIDAFLPRPRSYAEQGPAPERLIALGIEIGRASGRGRV